MTQRSTSGAKQALVELHDVAVAYTSEPVLHGVDLHIEAAEIVAIVGTSGSGKSTLLRACVGLLEPTSGRVQLFGEDLYALAERERGRLLTHLGLLFQGGALFGSMSVIENVMFPARKRRDLPEAVLHELALIKLAQVGIAELAERLPQELSGGQTKRVALARANVLDPRLLLCDEPTSGLDPVNAAMLSRLLRRVRDRDGVAVMLVTHDMDMVMDLADRVVVIANGEVCVTGPPAVVRESRHPDVRVLFREAGQGPS